MFKSSVSPPDSRIKLPIMPETSSRDQPLDNKMFATIRAFVLLSAATASLPVLGEELLELLPPPPLEGVLSPISLFVYFGGLLLVPSILLALLMIL